MDTLPEKIKKYALKHPKQFHSIVAIFSFLGYVGIIIFGFAPVNQRILQSGYSTGDLQSAANTQEVATILIAWTNIMEEIILLSILDYCFIVTGLILFISLYFLILRSIPESTKWNSVVIIGIVITMISRTLDALEDLWAILIYTNPNGYAPILIPMLNFTQSIKWVFVAMEYVFLLLGFAGFFKLRKMR
jgi:hypothetical protein